MISFEISSKEMHSVTLKLLKMFPRKLNLCLGLLTLLKETINNDKVWIIQKPILCKQRM